MLVSASSVGEVAVLEAEGRLRFSLETGERVRGALSAPGLRLADLSPEIAVESARLPSQVHGDPADRILMATARRTGAALVTRGARIPDYAGTGHLAALDAAS